MDEYSGDEDEDDEKQQLSRLKETLNEFINASDQNSFADDDKNVSKEGLVSDVNWIRLIVLKYFLNLNMSNIFPYRSVT